MVTLIKEDFKDLELNEFPYDKAHSALGEYHYVKQEGNYGKWYDPICLHQWRSMDGSWLVTSDGTNRYLEQNRGDNTKASFKNVFCCLVHEQKIYSDYILEFELRQFELTNFSGMAFNYETSRSYDFIGIKGKDVLFIGDTLHDLEVANAMGAECMLVSCGHQSYEVLSKGNVKIIETINDLKEWC